MHGDGRTRDRALLGRHRVLEVEDDGIRPAGLGLGETIGAVPGHEQQ
jgi:hypothetical protein